MLERLLLENVQPHRRVDVELDSAVTCFVGPSDSGKSSVLRGLRWACLNKPSGDGMRRRGSDCTAARLWLDGGRSVARVKGKGANRYELDGAELPFDGAGRGAVPEPVAALLNVAEDNFQRQHDGHYWLCLPPGQVARELNAVVNLGVVDGTLAAAAAAVRAAQLAERTAEADLAASRAARDATEWALAADARLAALDAADAKLGVLAAANDALEALLAEAGRLRALPAAPDPAPLAAVLAKWADCTKYNDALEALLAGAVAGRARAGRARAEADRAAAELAGASAGRCPLCGRGK